jgi:hypothetical protein
MTPMRVPPDDLQEAPELAVLAVLDAALDQAVLSLIAQHGEISDHDSLVGLPPAAWCYRSRDLTRSAHAC